MRAIPPPTAEMPLNSRSARTILLFYSCRHCMTPRPWCAWLTGARRRHQGVKPQADAHGALDMKCRCVIEHRAGHVGRCDEKADLGASEHDALGAAGDKVAHYPQVVLPGAVVDDPARQLLEDDAVNQSAIPLGWDEDLEPVVSEARPVEVGFHDGCGAEQTQGVYAVSCGCVGGHVDDVDQWDTDRILQLVGHPVHGVRGQDQELRTGALEPLRPLGKVQRGLFPLLGADEAFDHPEVHAVEHELRGAMTAQVRVDALVDPTVVLRAGNTAHATQNTDHHHPDASQPRLNHSTEL